MAIPDREGAIMAKYADITVGLIEGGYGTREELIESYDLPEDATDYDIGYQAVAWGDADADGTLN